MTYVPTNWVTGDVITAEKLNNMETGISGSARVLNIEMTLTLDENEDHVLTCETPITSIINALENGYIITGEVNNEVEEDGGVYQPFLVVKEYDAQVEEGVGTYYSINLYFRCIGYPYSIDNPPILETYLFDLRYNSAGTEGTITGSFDFSSYTLTPYTS